ncbi:hypothetical protein Spp001_48 [Shewanella phage Spp001]|uniref:Uncharacterized protein n=1 Tax=Shewanella phage Spp001 TaxID=1445859 RepID=W6E9I9_9CAUD|nr:hypothetical protein Spp001_48 [Shewanella phage Spp001]AHJ10556.1 hypothetical protein Spp001_48 [Shewanella phage Spp001]
MLNSNPSGQTKPVTPVHPFDQVVQMHILENHEDQCPHCGCVIHGHYCGSCEVTVH